MSFRKFACGLGFAGRGDAGKTNQETNQKTRKKQPQHEEKREEREKREEQELAKISHQRMLLKKVPQRINI